MADKESKIQAKIRIRWELYKALLLIGKGKSIDRMIETAIKQYLVGKWDSQKGEVING